MSLSVKGRRSIWIGFDPRESAAYTVCKQSVLDNLVHPKIPVRPVILEEMRDRGFYYRPTERRMGRLYDVLSRRDDYDGAISTEFAISRFLVPLLAQDGWALFMDCDMMARANLAEVFAFAERHNDKAVLCVKHKYQPEATEKMDGQLQTKYPRKNWSSFCLFNCDHPANKSLSVDFVNTAIGRDLHHFCWLSNNDILGLDEAYNWIPGHSSPKIDPKVVHWSEGGPWFTGFENAPFADEWRQYQRRAA